MMGFTSAQRYYLSREPADMRKSYDGLSGLVRQGLGRDPLSGEVFIFLNRRRTMIKILVWDRSGFVVWSKRRSAELTPKPGAWHIRVAFTAAGRIFGSPELGRAGDDPGGSAPEQYPAAQAL